MTPDRTARFCLYARMEMQKKIFSIIFFCGKTSEIEQDAREEVNLVTDKIGSHPRENI